MKIRYIQLKVCVRGGSGVVAVVPGCGVRGGRGGRGGAGVCQEAQQSAEPPSSNVPSVWPMSV